MIKNIVYLALFLSVLSFWTSALRAQFQGSEIQSSKVPVVVELFTSQSCSSCPPADKFLDELSAHDNIITLSCHVTYWDHLHWKDTLSQKFCTNRQRQYSAYKKSKRVYTPQMVINGQDEFVGSRKSEGRTKISKAIKQKAVTPLTLTKRNQQIQITLPNHDKAPYTLWLMGYKQNHIENMKRGENRGKTVNYKNAVVILKNLGSWSGEARKLSVPIPQNTNINGIAIIAQRSTYGPITAAGMLNF